MKPVFSFCQKLVYNNFGWLKMKIKHNVYKCVAIRSDNTILERTIRLPSDWNYKFLGIILSTSVDSYDLLDNIVFLIGKDEVILDQNQNKITMDETPLSKLSKDEFKIVLNYLDGVSVTFNCNELRGDNSETASLSIHSIKGYDRVEKVIGDDYSINKVAWNPEINRLFKLHINEFLN